MVNVIMVLLSLIVPLAHLAFTHGPWARRNVPRVFLADQAAALIGWPKGSMFQFEVGLHDGAWGILGFLCVFIGGGFWLATALGWSFFMLGAAWGHVHEIIEHGNYAPYNFFPAITDTLIPLWLLGLL